MKSGLTLVKAEISNSIGVITLNDPRRHNALSTALIDDLCAALEEMRTWRSASLSCGARGFQDLLFGA